MNFQTINIGIFPSEAENAFELARSLQYAPRFTIIGLASHAHQSYYEFEKIRNDLPYIHENHFIERINRVIEEENITYIFPTHDSVALFLKEHEHRLNAKILCSDLETTKLCRNKAAFYTFFKDEDFCPNIFKNIEDIHSFPVFIKPSTGQGGQGCQKISSEEALQKALEQDKDIIISEYLPGQEFTLDCFTDRHGKLLFCGPRSRDVIKLGIAFVCPSVTLTPEMERVALRLNTILSPKGLRGLWFFQLKADAHGKLKILEIATRVASTMALYRQRGINFAQLTLYDALGFDVSILDNKNAITLSRSLHACYSTDIEYNTVFIDLDDTLIVRNKVNLLALTFVYQCINNKKNIILITRHKGDITSYLEKFYIMNTIFSDIISIQDNSKKSIHIKKILTDKKAIFIDNLFIERKDVQENLNIPVFDVDAIESLLEKHI